VSTVAQVGAVFLPPVCERAATRSRDDEGGRGARTGALNGRMLTDHRRACHVDPFHRIGVHAAASINIQVVDVHAANVAASAERIDTERNPCVRAGGLIDVDVGGAAPVRDPVEDGSPAIGVGPPGDRNLVGAGGGQVGAEDGVLLAGDGTVGAAVSGTDARRDAYRGALAAAVSPPAGLGVLGVVLAARATLDHEHWSGNRQAGRVRGGTTMIIGHDAAVSALIGNVDAGDLKRGRVGPGDCAAVTEVDGVLLPLVAQWSVARRLHGEGCDAAEGYGLI